jgi:hypothetical protein
MNVVCIAYAYAALAIILGVVFKGKSVQVK